MKSVTSVSPPRKSIQIPSKTFLLGEYAVLEQGRAIVCAHQPCFRLTVTPSQTNAFVGVHPHSPSQRYYQANAKHFQHVALQFHDPHLGRGGFGGSSAEFLSLMLHHFSQPKLADLLEPFWAYHGTRPSGADLVTQFSGGIVQYHRQTQAIRHLNWPFPSLGFLIVATGNKQATHEHLTTLTLPSSVSTRLSDLVEQAITAFQTQDRPLFIQCINAYQQQLTQAQLCCASTQGLLSNFQQNPNVLASKGCGALGADVILLVSDREQQNALRQQCNALGLNVIATEQDRAEGAIVQQ